MGEVGFSGGTENGGKKKKKGGRKKGPTQRARLYAQILLKSKGTLSKKEAAMMAGFSESTAKNATVKIEDKHREYFQRLADVAIPDELLILKLREGLDATTVKTAVMDGTITDMQEFADFDTRHKYLETAAEWKGRVSRRGAGGHTEINLPITLVHSVPRPNRDINGTDKIGN